MYLRYLGSHARSRGLGKGRRGKEVAAGERPWSEERYAVFFSSSNSAQDWKIVCTVSIRTRLSPPTYQPFRPPWRALRRHFLTGLSLPSPYEARPTKRSKPSCMKALSLHKPQKSIAGRGLQQFQLRPSTTHLTRSTPLPAPPLIP